MYKARSNDLLEQYYNLLNSFVKFCFNNSYNVDLINEELYSIYNKVFLLNYRGISYLFIYNVNNNQKYDIQDFRSDRLSRKEMDIFIKLASENVFDEYKPKRYTNREMLKHENIDADTYELYSFPIPSYNITIGYVLIISNNPNESLELLSPDAVRFFLSIARTYSLARERAQFEKRIEYLSFNDPLTDLPNRMYFYELIVNAIQNAHMSNTKFILLIININGLMHINNSLGLDTGDMVLRETASRIKKLFAKQGAITSRLSGDDFSLLIPHTKKSRSIEDYCNMALSITKEPFVVKENKLLITLSIGASLFPNHGETVETLLKNADAAKNAASNAGKNSFKLYEEIMIEETEKTLFLNNNFPVAILKDEFELYYQSQVDVQTKQISSVEALIRWIHPKRGIITPFEFIPYAEKNNYSVQIDKIVLEKACKQILKWQKENLDLQISVNISPKHFKNGLILNTLHKVLDKYKSVNPSLLKIELLESTVLDDFDLTVKVIEEIKKIGASVALDDFGSGYSSLEYIASLPVDTIKIDRFFTLNLEVNPKNKIILKTIISLAREMKFLALAEGVETEAQFEYLKAIGCDVVQGYFFNKPLPINEFNKLLKAFNK